MSSDIEENPRVQLFRVLKMVCNGIHFFLGIPSLSHGILSLGLRKITGLDDSRFMEALTFTDPDTFPGSGMTGEIHHSAKHQDDLQCPKWFQREVYSV